MEGAEVVDNGEAISSITVDKRALLQPGGVISQEVELDGFLAEKYLLEATIYCGPERDSSGQAVNPSGNPELVIGLYGEGRKSRRRVGERDVTIAMPFQLRRSRGTFELRFENQGAVPVRVGHVVLRPVDGVPRFAPSGPAAPGIRYRRNRPGAMPCTRLNTRVKW